MTIALDHVRLEFAEMLRREAGLRSADLVRAFATVPRERFVGPGPWQILVAVNPVTYRETPDDDPRHLYANVLVALDASRQLNNGQPAALAGWLDALELTSGECFLHVGCGVGYYTAIVAEALSPGGSVVGLEVDAGLAERARRNLAPYANVTVVCDDGAHLAAGAFDAIFVNAGATEVLPRWTEQLRAGGRLLVPLTVGLPGMNVGLGHMLLVARRSGGDVARLVSPVGVFHCVGARSSEAEALLREAYARADEGTVRSLRRDAHERSTDCWLHGAHFCLSRLAVDERR